MMNERNVLITMCRGFIWRQIDEEHTHVKHDCLQQEVEAPIPEELLCDVANIIESHNKEER